MEELALRCAAFAIRTARFRCVWEEKCGVADLGS